jgi:hypothetical protein
MQRVGYIYEHICDYENLMQAFYKARKGTNQSHEAKKWMFHLENYIISLQKELKNQVYQPGNFRYFQ